MLAQCLQDRIAVLAFEAGHYERVGAILRLELLVYGDKTCTALRTTRELDARLTRLRHPGKEKRHDDKSGSKDNAQRLSQERLSLQDDSHLCCSFLGRQAGKSKKKRPDNWCPASYVTLSN